MIALLLLGCDTLNTIPLHFDGPAAAAWLPESEAHPFAGAIGFVSNSRSGDIVPVDLAEGRVLTDDGTASFLRASAIATGRERLLRDVVAFAADNQIMLWSLDVGSASLVQVPYLTGVDDDGHPIEVTPSAGEPTFVDADGSGDSPKLEEVSVRAGFTTTEDWAIEYDGSRWWAKGSRSGTQVSEPKPGKEYRSDHGQLGFTLSGEATAGDRFELRTDNGLVEWTYAGRPAALLGDETRLYVGIDAPEPFVGVIDPWTGAWLGSVPLPAGAQPWRMTRADDGTLYVADARNPAVYELFFATPGDPATATRRTLVTAAPVIDVAWQSGYGADGTPFESLFVAPLALDRVDVYDLLADAWHDTNPLDGEVRGVDLGSPVSGLGASVGSVWYQQPNEWGALPRVPTVAVTTQDGFVFLLDGQTGCGVVTERGPHGPNPTIDGSDTTWSELEDQGPSSNATLAIDSATDEQITVSSCGGVARGETWTVTYDSASVSWVVEGSLSGVQSRRAYADQRYVSDTGAVSFLVQSGSAAATDGDRFEFPVDRGLLTWSFTDKDENRTLDGLDHPWEAPARPLGFNFLAGPSGGGWDNRVRKEYMLVPVENSDIAARVFLDGAKAELDWE